MHQVEVLGLAVNVGISVEASYLPTPRGLTVLYGLNGAGKSQLLRALEDGLKGLNASNAECDLAVRVEWSEDANDHPYWVRNYVANWADPDEKFWPSDGVAPELVVGPRELVRRAVLDCLGRSRILAVASEESSSFNLDALASQIADQGLFFLEPRGRGHIARVGARASDDALQIAAAIEITRVNDASDVWDGRGEQAEGGPPDEAAHHDLDAAGLWDPMQGNGGLFASAADLDCDKPPYAVVYDSERPVSGAGFAQVITESGQAPDVRAMLGLSGVLGVSDFDHPADVQEAQLGVSGRDDTREPGLSNDERRFLKEVEESAQDLLDAVLMDAPKLELR